MCGFNNHAYRQRGVRPHTFLMHMLNSRKTWGIFFLLCLIYLAGVGVRRTVYEAQSKAYAKPIPFTLESAIQYRMTEQLATKQYTAHDAALQVPEGVDRPSTYSLGAEWVYVGISRLMPDSIPLAERVRWASLLWFCLGIPCLAIWVRYLFSSWTAGMVAGLVYAVTVAGVVRSTGQELSRENFALPLLLAHLLFHTRALIGVRNQSGWIGVTMTSAACLAVAMMTWDLVQFYVLCWALFALVIMWQERGAGEIRQGRVWQVEFGVLCLVGLLNPYLRSHGFLWSPAMLPAWCAMAICGYHIFRSLKTLKWVSALFVMATYGFFFVTRVQGSYEHFGKLVWAKIRFLNQKPIDPGQLDFLSSIMWTPALHSADWTLTMGLFHVMLPISVIAFTAWFLNRSDYSNPEHLQLIFFYGLSIVTFWLFVRFQVFLIIGVAALTGFLAGLWCRKWSGLRIAGLVFLSFAIFAQAGRVVKEPLMWGRIVDYYSLEELTDWLDANVKGRVVLANIGVSGSIVTYGHCSVVLHPKFETREARNRVQTYGETLFGKNEEVFRDWADNYEAEYYVYSLGEFSDNHPEWQMRYFVNKLNSPPDAAARMFEFDYLKSQYFEYQWGNNKYRVFRIRSKHDERHANEYGLQAEHAFQEGHLVAAQEWAVAALRIQPDHVLAQKILKHVGSLQNQGFEYAPAGL